MSGQIKLSKIFYINPTSLPTPPSYSPHALHTLKEDILRDGFGNSYPILIDLDSNHIIDGNHRLAIALQLKLDHVPVRFEYLSTI